MSLTRTTTLTKEELLANIEKLNLSIKEADDKMAEANRKSTLNDVGKCLGMTALCCCAVLMIGAGAASMGEGVHEMGHGHVGLGFLDMWAGSNMVSMGSDIAGAALTIPAANSNWNEEQTYNYYSNQRTRLTNMRTQYQNDLYLQEKSDILDRLEENNHPYRDTILQQFTAIDLQIMEGNFNPQYANIATNTRNILDATTFEEQKAYLKKHEKLAMETSIGKNVAGALLAVVGVGLVTLSVLAAVATFGISTPVSALLAGIGLSMTATAITSGVVGAATLAGSVGLFVSGRKKRRESIPEEVLDLSHQKPVALKVA